MRILAISDVEEEWLTVYYDAERMRGVDLIISCGDLPASYLEHIVTLSNVPLAYVPGNHDTAYRQHAPEGCVPLDGAVRSFRGLNIMGIGGSVRYNDRVYGFTEQEMRWRAMSMGAVGASMGGVDILVTHAPVAGYGDMEDLPHRGFAAFETLLNHLKPRYLVHGHIHMSYARVKRVRTHPSGTTLVNACGHTWIDIPDETIDPTRHRGFLRPSPL